jgi:hypothetical protein
MKSERSLGKSRNARLNRARDMCENLLDHLQKVEGTPWSVLLPDADFWAECRSATAELCQCVHEANAYNNCMADDGVSFEQDEFSATVP